MNAHIFMSGSGLLADTVNRILTIRRIGEVTRQQDVPHEALIDADLAVVLDDAWHPSIHLAAENVFRSSGTPWLRGFVTLGHGCIGPLVQPGEVGCSYCADLRMLMADAERQKLFQLRMQLASTGGRDHDVWASRTGVIHMANLMVAQIEQILKNPSTSQLVDHVIITHLRTLETGLHHILPHAACPVCGCLPDDSRDAAVVELRPSPKISKESFRSLRIQSLQHKLMKDYVDHATGLFNANVQDLITPFAAVGVNLPLLVGDEGTSGRAHSYEECAPIAILEGLERYCGLEPRGKKSVIYDTYSNLQEHALNPVTVGLHDTDQYHQPDFPFQAFHKDNAMNWVWGYSLTEMQPILVPQGLAYYSLGESSDSFVYETSNGCAVGGSLEEAIFHGILEIVERDAFLITWYANLPLPVVDMATSRDSELHWMIERIRLIGYDLHVYNATMDNNIPTVFVVAKNRRSSGLNVMCAAGTHLNPIRAIKGAIQETAGMLLRFDDKLAANRSAYVDMLHNSCHVRHMEDHSMLYGLPEAEERLAFLLRSADDNRSVQTLEQAFQTYQPPLDITDDVKHLLSVFKQLNLDVIVINQTSPELERNHLYCVKIIIPGMLPMTFGHHLRRLENLERVLTVPKKLGFTNKILTPDELNPYPHPFP